MFEKFINWIVAHKNGIDRLIKISMVLIVFLGFAISIAVIVVAFLDGFTFWSGVTDYATTSYIGSFIGGSVGVICTLLNAYLLYRTLKAQKSFNESVARDNCKEAFIKRYFELLHTHTEIVSQMKIDSNVGRQVFKTLYDEFSLIYRNFENKLAEIAKWNPASLEDENDKKIYEFVQGLDIKNGDYEKFKIIYSYGYFFYGCCNYSMCEGTEEPEELVNVYLAKEVAKALRHRIQDNGRSYLLGHYFRQLYMCVRFIDSSKVLDDTEKYTFVKMLRSQMSDYEQILLYYNSMSPMGLVWQDPVGKNNQEEMSLMCKYRLLKNIPHFIEYPGIDPMEYFKVEKAAYAQNDIKLFEQTPGFGKEGAHSGFRNYCFFLFHQGK